MAAVEDIQEELTPDDSPAGTARRWRMELAEAKKQVEKWHTQGKTIVERFRDEREGTNQAETRWNLFSANVITQRAMLYGNTPKVSVDRRFADAGDDTARIAGELLDRILNTDIERDGDGYREALRHALSDRLLPGFGLVRLRYVADFEAGEETPAKMDPATGQEIAPAVPAIESKTREDVEVDYVHWRDFLWSPGARTWSEARWVAFRAQLSRAELVKRFGQELGKKIPLNTKDAAQGEEKQQDPWGRADVWEIWDKETRKVRWLAEGMPTILDEKEDPLELERFFPCPEPLLANVTTDTLVPRPDYVLAQDLYEEINTVSTRVTVLEKAIRVAGVYNKSAGGLKALLSESTKNELIPVDNWGMFAEKGGLKGAIDWLPLEQVVNALLALRDYRREVKDALYEITGMSDIMRGQASDGDETATAQSIKARFGSVRIQSLQDEVARFASDAQRIKAEIIAKHFEPNTIVERSNARFGFEDVQEVMKAVQLIKSDLSCYRIEVKPEAISLTDFAALKSERLEVLETLAKFFQSAAPLMQSNAATVPFLLQMLQWCISGLRGSSGIEGVLDHAIEAAKQQAAQPQPQQPDPKVQALQLKAQVDQAKGEQDLRNDMTRMQMEVRAEEQKQAIQTRYNVDEQAQKDILKAQAQQRSLAIGGPGSKP